MTTFCFDPSITLPCVFNVLIKYLLSILTYGKNILYIAIHCKWNVILCKFLSSKLLFWFALYVKKVFIGSTQLVPNFVHRSYPQRNVYYFRDIHKSFNDVNKCAPLLPPKLLNGMHHVSFLPLFSINMLGYNILFWN
jgi:hypothetical protein